MSDNLIQLTRVDIPNLNDVVYDTLRQAILRYDFSPGQRLDLNELENHLQVSRTPLKNALTRLEIEGLVQIHPRRGTFITELSAQKLEEDYKIRSAYELYVALCIFKYLTPQDYEFFTSIHGEMEALATKADTLGWHTVIHDYLELDYKLHERLVICGGTPKMVTLWQQTNIHMQVGQLAERINTKYFDSIHYEHCQILKAIDAGSPEWLSAVLLNHLDTARLTIKNLITNTSFDDR